MIGLGILVTAGWFIYEYARKPTIHFIGYLPAPIETGISGGVPTFVIRNDTRHAFSIYGDERLFRIVSDSGVREVRECMNCTGAAYHTISPRQTVQFFELVPEMKSGERYALGIRFYRGTSQDLSAPRSVLSQTISHLLGRWFDQPKPTWSDLAEFKP